MNVAIAKSLVADIADLKIYLDGANLEYNVSSAVDSWILTFNCAHGTHNVVINLVSAQEHHNKKRYRSAVQANALKLLAVT